MITALTLLAGLALLIVGAEMLVKGASRVAAGFGISPLVIGLTVVAFGTSSPEMAISVSSAWKGEADIAVGNVVGSNIFNVLFILGLSALITPLVVSKQLVKLDVPLMIGVSVLAFLLSMDGRIAFWEGAILFVGVIGYTILAIRMGKASGETGEAVEGADRTGMNLGLIAVGLVLLVLGSQWLVSAAITIATAMGVSELVIGLTIVAAGTSMPEVATSVTAAIRGQRDIAVGNVVGSNIFNILAVLGLTAMVAPGGLPVSQAALNFDYPVMMAVAVACLPIFFVGYTIQRWEGALFLGYYVAYTVYLVFAATEHDALPVFSQAMMWFVVPLTVITLLIVLARELKARRSRQGT
ncbi:calcium/sodium antiporter [Silanimonas sp.]|jgi:cation:H+ antiporter|uniref:calcium/sodium antiporter n=1 Tax=Silanimonas sp. TaxID=1929290 RepID=UPI0037CABDA0